MNIRIERVMRVPSSGELGPDPEPLGERFERRCSVDPARGLRRPVPRTARVAEAHERTLARTG